MSMPVRKEGELLKWTNYLMGWQPRWFVLDGNVLSYCTSEAEVSQGCKGSVNVGDCEVNASSHDQCRFDIVVPGELCFYVRAKTKTERQEWLIALGTAKNQFCKALSIPSTTTPRSEDVSLCDLFIVEQVLGFRDEILCKKEIEPKDEVLLTACNNFLETVDAFSWYNASMNAEECTSGSRFIDNKFLHSHSRQHSIAESAIHSGGMQTDRSAQPNLVDEFGEKITMALLAKGVEAFPALISSLVLTIEILDVIGVAAMNVVKLEIADCMQVFKTAKRHSSEDIVTLGDMMIAELQIPRADVIKNSVQRFKRVVDFLHTFFDELRPAEADPFVCARTAYTKSMKGHQPIVLQYVFMVQAEDVHMVNSRKQIGANLATQRDPQGVTRFWVGACLRWTRFLPGTVPFSFA
uniref:Pleckstrin homology domain-containing family A member 8 n=1 Tax=Trichuris muris TaxID=70415 RepID=A0A5S6QAF7_TRIMR